MSMYCEPLFFMPLSRSHSTQVYLPSGKTPSASSYWALTCVQAMCSRFLDTAGPSEHLVLSGTGGFVKLLSSTERKHCTRLGPGFLGSNASGPESRISPLARYRARV